MRNLFAMFFDWLWPAAEHDEPAGLDDPHDPQFVTRAAFDDDFPQLERTDYEKMH